MLLDRFQACLLGVQIGDALGAPWEIYTKEEILQATNGQGITDFLEPPKRRIKDTAFLKLGETTDDTQLSWSVAHALIEAGEYSQAHQTKALVDAYRSTKFGWGGTTARAAEELGSYFYRGDGKPAMRSPYQPATGTGGGNGVAMKIAPLALWHAARPTTHDRHEILRDQVMRLGLMTHPDPKASLIALAVAEVIVGVIRVPITNVQDSPWRLESLTTLMAVQEGWYRPFGWQDTEIQERLAAISDLSLESLERNGSGFSAMESVIFALGVFFRHPTDFRAGILEAVNAGGDTDSVASMVGAMIGANCGLEAIPKEWREFRPEYQEALTLGEELYKKAQYP